MDGTVTPGLVTIVMWISMSAIGIIISCFNILDSRKDLVHQLHMTERRRERRLIAKVNMINEVMRFIVLILFLIAGILVAAVQFSANPPPASLYVRSVILLTIAMLVAKTLLHRWLRYELKYRRTN